MEAEKRIHQGYVNLLGQVIWSSLHPYEALITPIHLARAKRIPEINKWRDKEVIRRKCANRKFGATSKLISLYADCVGLDEEKIRTRIINSNI
jgi:hypothetical protein